jgi:hypothetical protein
LSSRFIKHFMQLFDVKEMEGVRYIYEGDVNEMEGVI